MSSLFSWSEISRSHLAFGWFQSGWSTLSPCWVRCPGRLAMYFHSGQYFSRFLWSLLSSSSHAFATSVSAKLLGFFWKEDQNRSKWRSLCLWDRTIRWKPGQYCSILTFLLRLSVVVFRTSKGSVWTLVAKYFSKCTHHWRNHHPWGNSQRLWRYYFWSRNYSLLLEKLTSHNCRQ